MNIAYEYCILILHTASDQKYGPIFSPPRPPTKSEKKDKQSAAAFASYKYISLP